MIKRGKEFLESNGLNVRFFAAPAHSMDENTVLALKKLNINIVSDGFFSSCTIWKGIKWIPLKTWRENTFFLGNLNTVCKHPKEINGSYEFKLEKLRNRKMTNFNEEVLNASDLDFKQIIFHNIYNLAFIVKRFLRKYF